MYILHHNKEYRNISNCNTVLACWSLELQMFEYVVKLFAVNEKQDILVPVYKILSNKLPALFFYYDMPVIW